MIFLTIFMNYESDYACISLQTWKKLVFTPGPISGIERLGCSTNLLLDVHQTPNLLKINF
jgi:hypothetical protein